MNPCIVYNPISGKGSSAKVADKLFNFLRSRGHSPLKIPSKKEDSIAWLAPHVNSESVVIAVGGDGTVRSVLKPIVASGASLYHYPAGNENLFAREFQMSSDFEKIERALIQGKIKEINFAKCNRLEPMVLMASIGLDSQIVHKVASYRRSTVSYFSYLIGFFRTFFSSYSCPSLTIEVDGNVFIKEKKGWLVVANCCQYGARIDPVPEASLEDDLLDVSFFPASTLMGQISWFVRCRLGNGRKSSGSRHVRGKKIVIKGSSHFVWQADGDACQSNSLIDFLEVLIESKKLRVIDVK